MHLSSRPCVPKRELNNSFVCEGRQHGEPLAVVPASQKCVAAMQPSVGLQFFAFCRIPCRAEVKGRRQRTSFEHLYTGQCLRQASAVPRSANGGCTHRPGNLRRCHPTAGDPGLRWNGRSMDQTHPAQDMLERQKTKSNTHDAEPPQGLHRQLPIGPAVPLLPSSHLYHFVIHRRDYRIPCFVPATPIQ